MATFIGAMMVQAEPQDKVITSVLTGETPEVFTEPGYKITYKGRTIWLPKEEFESSFFEIQKSSKLVDSDIDNFLNRGQIRVETIGTKSTLVEVTLPNGWVDYEVSSCVDPANYDINLGRKYALENIKHRLWKNLGFVLQWATNNLAGK